MSSQKNADPKADVKALLLADYRDISESLWRNEQIGETRVNWFIGIVTAVSGGLIGLTSAEHRPHGEPLRLIYVSALFALLCFGVITLFRIRKRNETTDGFKKDSDRIRQMFRDHFDETGLLRSYYPFRAEGQKDPLRKIGGLAYTVSTINSLILAGIVAALIYPFGWTGNSAADRQDKIVLTYGWAAAAFVAAFAAQFFWIRHAEENAKKQLAITTHAGGIVFRTDRPEVEYLLVGPSKKKRTEKEEWILPKGHLDHGEEPWQTAVREVEEETGYVCHLIAPVGTEQFETPEEKVKAKYYLMKYESEVKREDERLRKWLSFADAVKTLTYPQSASLLHKAEQKRQDAKKLEAS